MGHRNTLRMARHPITGAIWQVENGPNGGDEANILVPGGNYGWPLVSLGRTYAGPWQAPFSKEVFRDALAGTSRLLFSWGDTPTRAPHRAKTARRGPRAITRPSGLPHNRCSCYASSPSTAHRRAADSARVPRFGTEQLPSRRSS